jgi:BASS family bile acid:Na+ symporter
VRRATSGVEHRTLICRGGVPSFNPDSGRKSDAVSEILLLKIFAGGATFALMLDVSLRLGREVLLRVRARPDLFLRTLAAVWIGVPLLTLLVIRALDVPPRASSLLLLMAFCPGVPLVLVSTRSVQGALPTAFLALILAAVTEPFLIPYGARIVSALQPVDLTVRPRHVLAVILPTVFLPVVLGFAIHDLFPRAAPLLARISNVVFGLALTGCVILVLVKAAPLLLNVPALAIVAVVLITLGDALIGYWAGGPDRDDQKAIALAVALGNPALALAVVEVSYPGYPAFAMVAVYLLVRFLALAPLRSWLKRAKVRHALP